jgi:hypothetical protein
VTIKTHPSVRVYERGGAVAAAMVLLPVEAAAQLTEELQLALASPESPSARLLAPRGLRLSCRVSYPR